MRACVCPYPPPSASASRAVLRAVSDGVSDVWEFVCHIWGPIVVGRVGG